MKCERCKANIAQGDEREHLGQTLCEDCLVDALSPVKACDPWAVHSAKTYEQYAGRHQVLTPLQQQIIHILQANGPIAPENLMAQLDVSLPLKDLEREFAALRHMEKVRAEKQGTKKLWRLW